MKEIEKKKKNDLSFPTKMIGGKRVRVSTLEERKAIRKKEYAQYHYDDETLVKHELGIIETIVKHKLMRFTHVFSKYVDISEATAFNMGLEQLESIKSLLKHNRTDGVNYLLQRWITGDNSTLQIAAMRLICESEDHRRLNQHYQELTGNKMETDKLMGFEIITNGEPKQLKGVEVIDGEVIKEKDDKQNKPRAKAS